MSTFWERVNGIKQQQAAAQTVKQDAAIAKAADFWNRVDAIKAQQNSSNGVVPSASEVIRNSGSDPSIVAFANSPYYPGNSGSSGSSNPSIVLSGNDLTRPKASVYSGGSSAGAVYSAPVKPAQINYLNAEIAKHYGMSKSTAYQEALSNTAYQRSVKDMVSAGLNPAVIYGAGKGSPADGVYSVREAVSGSSSGAGGYSYSRRSGGSSKSNGKLFTTGQYYGLSAAAGLVSAVVSGNPNTYWIGQTVAQGFMTAANSLFKK